MTPTNYHLTAFTKSRVPFTATATIYVCQYPTAARSHECRTCRTAEQAKYGSLYKRKRVKFYQNSSNLHFANDFGEVSGFPGTHRLPFNLVKATTKVRSARLGPKSKSEGVIFWQKVTRRPEDVIHIGDPKKLGNELCPCVT